MATVPPPRKTFSLGNVLLLIVPLAAAVGGYWYWQTNAIEQGIERVDYVKSLTGYLKRAGDGRLKLDPRYADLDADLLADPPTDVVKQIDPPTLVFSPIAGSSDDHAVWDGFLDHLKGVTGKAVEFKAFDNHTPQFEELRDGRLHVVAVSTGLVPTAVNQDGYRPLVTMAPDAGPPAYTMKFLVRADHPAKSLADLKAAGPDAKLPTITFTSPGSHSGFKAALVTLRDGPKMTPGADYLPTLSGSHDASIHGLKEKQYSVVAVAGDLLARSNIDATSYRVIAESKPFPPASYGVPHALKPELAAKVRQAFETYPWAGSPLAAKYKSSGYTRFAPVVYKDAWEYVREIDQAMTTWDAK